MMLVTEEVEVFLNKKTYKKYQELGYNIPQRINCHGKPCLDETKPIKIKVNDLAKGSHVYIECYCDYCLEKGIRTIVKKEYREYLKSRNIIEKDCCDNCRGIKTKETNLILYGVDSVAKLQMVKDKRKETNIKKYGVENYSETDECKEKVKETSLKKFGVEHYAKTNEFLDRVSKTNLERYGSEILMNNDKIKEKVRQTNLERYGVENVFQNEEIKDKIKQTNLNKYGIEYYTQTDEYKERAKQTSLGNWGCENPAQSQINQDKMKKTSICRYGVEYYSQTEEYKKKCINTCREKYGVDWVMQNPKIKMKSLNHMLQAKYNNKSFICSNQQMYLFKIVNECEINYPVGNCILDLAFVSEMQYLEYDGGFHNGRVILGDMSQEEFERKEFLRNKFLSNKGWKRIRIISYKDYLPQDNTILRMISEAKEYLNTGRSWIEFDIDNSKVKCSQYEKEYDFGELRKIKKSDIEDMVS